MSPSKPKAFSETKGTLAVVKYFVHTHLLDEFFEKHRVFYEKGQKEPEAISFEIGLSTDTETTINENGEASGGITVVTITECWTESKQYLRQNLMTKPYVRESAAGLAPYQAKPMKIELTQRMAARSYRAA